MYPFLHVYQLSLDPTLSIHVHSRNIHKDNLIGCKSMISPAWVLIAVGQMGAYKLSSQLPPSLKDSENMALKLRYGTQSMLLVWQDHHNAFPEEFNIFQSLLIFLFVCAYSFCFYCFLMSFFLTNSSLYFHHDKMLVFEI